MRMPKGVRKITVVQGDSATVVFDKAGGGKKKKKGTKGLKLARKSLRRMAKAAQTVSTELVDRMDRSDEKKKDGWVKDAPKNVFKATKKGLKEMRKALPI
ncbi:MAG: hypothetical protein HY720_25790 [Planctomycetes bacterium]|nr:hypothetical protein [Planctomycetota bacterium]